jgi:hypothetical protein
MQKFVEVQKVVPNERRALNTIWAIGDSMLSGYRSPDLKSSPINFAQFVASRFNSNIINLAQAGATSFEVKNQVLQLVPSDVVIISVGSNDIFCGTKPSDFKSNIQYILTMAQKSAPTVLLLGLPDISQIEGSKLVEIATFRLYNQILNKSARRGAWSLSTSIPFVTRTKIWRRTASIPGHPGTRKSPLWWNPFSFVEEKNVDTNSAPNERMLAKQANGCWTTPRTLVSRPNAIPTVKRMSLSVDQFPGFFASLNGLWPLGHHQRQCADDCNQKSPRKAFLTPAPSA